MTTSANQRECQRSVPAERWSLGVFTSPGDESICDSHPASSHSEPKRVLIERAGRGDPVTVPEAVPSRKMFLSTARPPALALTYGSTAAARDSPRPEVVDSVLSRRLQGCGTPCPTRISAFPKAPVSMVPAVAPKRAMMSSTRLLPRDCSINSACWVTDISTAGSVRSWFAQPPAGRE